MNIIVFSVSVIVGYNSTRLIQKISYNSTMYSLLTILEITP